MIRLWNRVGIFRLMSVLVLASGLVGGLLLANHERRGDLTSKTAEVAADSDDVRQLVQDLSDAKDAQDKVNQVVGTDADRAKAAQAAQDQSRASQAADRNHQRSSSPSASGKPGVTAGPAPASCDVYSGNKKTGCTLMLQAGFALDQMTCLDKLWTRESHWNEKAANASGAYGIPQANPGSKMASFGGDWKTNPATQIAWGLSYIKSKYSNPCGAWAKSEKSGWY